MRIFEHFLTLELAEHAKCLTGNLAGEANVLVGHRRIHKVVVMVGEEHAALYALCNPFLMKNQVVALGDS